MDEEQVKAFDPGLSKEEQDILFDLNAKIADAKFIIEHHLPKHRNYSLVVTKLDEARHWLRDRWHRAPQTDER